MNYIYIIAWCIVEMVPTGCPDKIKADDFGRINRLYSSCAVYHTKKETTCGFKKTFHNRDSAMFFYQRAIKDGGLSNLKIDSIK